MILILIFVCITEDAVSSGFLNLVNRNLLKLVPDPRGCFVPSHCLFVDDIMLFCRGNKAFIDVLTKLFTRYALASGQVVNQVKSTIFSGSISDAKLHHISNLTGFKIGACPFIYPGVPIFKDRPKASLLKSLADKVLARLSEWNDFLLSFAGRV